MRGRLAFLAGSVTFAFACSVAPAGADHHFMKISEVYPGTGAFPDSAFIELQMRASGQHRVGGHDVTAYDAAGTETFSLTLPGDVMNGQSQRTVLVGDSFADGGSFGDFLGDDMGTQLVPSGGAACFISASPSIGPVDCVSWGNFAGSAPDPTGTPVAPTGIPDGSSLTRSIARGCPTLLEAGDDTNSSAADFTVTVTETPQTNSDPVTNSPCPNTRFTKTPKKKTTKRRAKFKFKATPAPSGFECKLDDGGFRSCESPFAKRVKRGKHKFKVLADGEVKAESYSWKVVRK